MTAVTGHEHTAATRVTAVTGSHQNRSHKAVTAVTAPPGARRCSRTRRLLGWSEEVDRFEGEPLTIRVIKRRGVFDAQLDESVEIDQGHPSVG